MDDWTTLDSTMIKRVRHDPEKNELHVQFAGGKTYIYSGVAPEDHDDLLAATSHGEHFHREIRGKYPHRLA